MFSKVMSAKPDLACQGRRKRKIKTGKTRIHLDAFEVVPHEFSDLKRQLPLCDVFANSLTVRRQDLAITLVKTSRVEDLQILPSTVRSCARETEEGKDVR